MPFVCTVRSTVSQTCNASQLSVRSWRLEVRRLPLQHRASDSVVGRAIVDCAAQSSSKSSAEKEVRAISNLESLTSELCLQVSGDQTARVTPVPIPNTEVKPRRADDTARVTVWERRSSPELNPRAALRGAALLFLASSVHCGSCRAEARATLRYFANRTKAMVAMSLCVPT
jgi:hypothetical protein